MRLNPGDSDVPLVAVSANIPDTIAIQRIRVKDLPGNWNAFPAPEILKKIGMDWAKRGGTAVLAVPSAIIPQQTNYLINPNHREFKRIRTNPAQEFEFDPRMWK